MECETQKSELRYTKQLNLCQPKTYMCSLEVFTYNLFG